MRKKNKLTGSFEQSPRLINQYQEYMGSDEQTIAPTDTQLREDLADAMRESPRDSGKSNRFVISQINLVVSWLDFLVQMIS